MKNPWTILLALAGGALSYHILKKFNKASSNGDTKVEFTADDLKYGVTVTFDEDGNPLYKSKKPGADEEPAKRAAAE